jgi:hypothetical protein
MAKRLTDSEKWKDAWFMDLPSKYKLFWLYLLDNCDHAGIWRVNFKVANFHIGEELTQHDVKMVLLGRINFLSDEYWQVTKFIDFQYGGVKNDAVGKSVQKILNSHNLPFYIAPIKGHDSPYQGTKDKDKVMVIDKDKAIVNYGVHNEKRYILIIPDTIGSQKIRVNGEDGFNQLFEVNQSVISHPGKVNDFLFANMGAHYTGFMHVYRAFSKYITNG